MIEVVPFMLLPFAAVWLSAPALRKLGWPAIVVGSSGCLVGVLGGVAYIDAFAWHADANSALVLIFLPVYQAGAIALVALGGVIIGSLLSRKEAVAGDRGKLGT